MMKYKVKIEKTANKFINKFEINSFITNHKNYEYSNIDTWHVIMTFFTFFNNMFYNNFYNNVSQQLLQQILPPITTTNLTKSY